MKVWLLWQHQKTFYWFNTKSWEAYSRLFLHKVWDHLGNCDRVWDTNALVRIILDLCSLNSCRNIVCSSISREQNSMQILKITSTSYHDQHQCGAYYIQDTVQWVLDIVSHLPMPIFQRTVFSFYRHRNFSEKMKKNHRHSSVNSLNRSETLYLTTTLCWWCRSSFLIHAPWLIRPRL